MRGAECSTDRTLIMSKLSLSVHPKVHRTPYAKKLDHTKLKDRSARNEVAQAISTFQPIHTTNINDLDEEWTHIRDQILKASEKVLGPSFYQQKDWFDDNAGGIHDLLAAKSKAHNDWLSNPSSNILKTTFQNLRQASQGLQCEMENSWWIERARELHQFADINDQHGFHNSL